MAKEITFQELENKDLNGQEITIRGFLYQNSSGQYILANEPNLKSCCLTGKNKIIVEGNMKPSLTVMNLQGKIYKDNNIHVLKEAQVVPTIAVISFSWELAVGFIVIAIVLYFKMRLFKPN